MDTSLKAKLSEKAGKVEFTNKINVLTRENQVHKLSNFMP